MKRFAMSGVVQVGMLYGPMAKCGLARYVLIASIESRRKTQILNRYQQMLCYAITNPCHT